MAAAGPVAAFDRLRSGISPAFDPVVALHPAGPGRRLAGRSSASARSGRTARGGGSAGLITGADTGHGAAQRAGGSGQSGLRDTCRTSGLIGGGRAAR
ncbi:hypothetical protein, partial [Novacetimonas hansenii]|uniref:hypothetical protein n=1 Tax=Novacetimonas hansenii TaxID=436 RepID=UPI001907C5C0